MKRKSLAIIGLASPVLIGICALTILFMGAMGWLFFRADDGEIVKIATVGPFFTLKVFDDEPEQAPPQADIVAEVTPTAPPVQTVQTEMVDVSTNLEADTPLLSPDEIEQQLGFSLPIDSVNSITQDGLGNRLVIPKLKLDAPIILAPIENQTWKVDHLGQAVGHLEGTAKPGSNSNIVLAAHVTLDTGEYGPFAGLGQLSSGDSVYIYDDNQQQFEYVIDSHDTVDRTAVEVTYPTDIGQLTLITCNNWNAEEGRYVERLVFKGHLLN